YPLFVFEQPSDEWIKPRTIPYVSTPQPQPSVENIKISPLLTMPSTGSSLRTYVTDSSKSKYIWWESETHSRENFNVRAWVNQLGMKPVGAHLVRCEWDENVDSIFERYGIQKRAFKKIRSEETSRADLPNKFDYRDFPPGDID